MGWAIAAILGAGVAVGLCAGAAVYWVITREV